MAAAVMTKNGTLKQTRKGKSIYLLLPLLCFPRRFSLFEMFITAHFNVDFEQMMAGRRCSQTKHTQVLLSNQTREGGKCVKMATYTKHIHGCAYRDHIYKSQAAAKESRSQKTQDVRRKALRLSEATTRYSEVTGNRRDIGSMKF